LGRFLAQLVPRRTPFCQVTEQGRKSSCQ
jgi:hypothetical protein